ncbi:DNA polymerase III subunit alpha, partial [bacterium]|nr:DNA polymerase III subunit alpha [bacterium]
VAYINECREMGVRVLPPDVNESYAQFTVVGDDIRFGLAAVKNVGEGAIQSIIESREKEGKFTSLYQFCEEADLRLVNKRVIESLIKCGAFDSLQIRRSQLMAISDNAVAAAQDIQKARERGQKTFFEDFEAGEDFRTGSQSVPDIPEWPENKLLAFEKGTIGFYVTGHPLAKYENLIRSFTTATTAQLTSFSDGEGVTLGGIIGGIRKMMTRKGERMAFFNLEDLEGMVRVTVFSTIFEKFSALLRHDSAVLVKGRVDLREERPKITANEIIPLDEAQERLAKSVHIKLITTGLEKETLSNLREILLSHSGGCPVYLHFITGEEEAVISVNGQLRVSPKADLVREVKELVGEESIWMRRGQ